MSYEDTYEAMRNAMADAEPKPQPLAIPLKPFRAQRNLSIDEGEEDLDDVAVLGLRFVPEEGEWKFVCVNFDGSREIYVTEAEALRAESLPAL